MNLSFLWHVIILLILTENTRRSDYSCFTG